MWALDASAIIHAWDNYPESQFPGMWSWIDGQIFVGNVSIPSVALDEVHRNSPECGNWISAKNIHLLHPTTGILLRASALKDMLGIVGDQYGAGVGENDLIIIATAEHHAADLITNEKIQLDLPKNLKSYRIPAVCSLKSPKTRCVDFLGYIRQSGAKF